MARRINPIVGEISPNIYNAAKMAGLSDPEQTIMEQWSFTVKNAKRLRTMDAKAAKKEFQSLDEDAQRSIRAIYPNAEFAKDDPTLADRAIGVVGTVTKALASPIISTYQAAVEYGKALNTGYSAARQIAQGESPALIQSPSFAANQIKSLKNPFAGTVWTTAYNGKELYDKGAINRLEQRYGVESVFVAKGLVAGRTPGEVIEQYGKVDEKIIAAITSAFDEPEKFNLIVQDVKYAQTSPGRDITRAALEAKPTDKGGTFSRMVFGERPDPEKVKSYQKIIKRSSGLIDAIYQLAIDPLTYVTGGTTKAATKGAAMAQTVAKQAQDGNYSGAIKQVFENPDVRVLWSDLGKEIKNFAEAPNRAAQTTKYREIVQAYPGFNDFGIITTLAKAKVFTPEIAESFFGEIDNVHRLLNGRVDGVTFVRNGIATARNQRQISAGMAKTADAILNPGVANKVDADKLDKLQARGMSSLDILKTVGEEIDNGVNLAGIAKLTDIDKDIKKARSIAQVLGRLATRAPGGSRILFGADAVKTAEQFRLVARQAFSRDVADFVTFEYLDASTNDQIVMLRNLYGMILHRYGLYGTPEGRELADEIMKKTFSNKSGMTGVVDTQVPTEFIDNISEHVIRISNDEATISARGAIQPSQLTEGIATLPYEEIIAVAAKTRRKDSIPALFDGATRNKYVTEFVNLWTIFTLFPRLGIRSAIDETFMYALSAPLQDLAAFARPSMYKQKEVLTALTGSEAAVGPIKRGLDKVFRGGGALGKLSLDERIAIPAQIAEAKGIPVEEVTHMMIRQETVSRVFSLYGVDESVGNFKWIREAFIHHPDVLNSMASSVAARTSLGGRFDKQIIDAVFTESTLSQALDDVGVKAGRKFRKLSSEQLRKVNDKYLTLAHFDQFFRMFAANTKTFGDGVIVDPATAFFRNNGLRTAKDFATARTEMLERIGVKYDYQINQFYIDPKRKDSVEKVLSEFGDTTYFRQRGIKDAEIARIHMETMLLDLRNIFHGGPKSFNDELFDYMVAKHNDLVAYEMQAGKEVAGKWSKVAGRMPFEDFERVTVGKQLRGEINTAIEFVGVVPKRELESAYNRFGNRLMEEMDRQVTGIFRQPAVISTYTRLREGYSGFQDELVRVTKKNLLEENKGMKDEVAQARAEQFAAKRYTEIAMNEAVDSVLKYVDNPAIRSNLAMSTRTVARFYRATEDFWRRYYRLMRDKPLQVIYRMRLAHQGLSARGDVFYDDNNEPYVVLPTDTIINTAVEPVVRKLTGSAFKVPQFNDVTLKLRLVNPSFSPDAGQPSLSGPVAAVGFLGFRSILGHLPGSLGDEAQNIADKFDTWALGNLGDNMTLRKAMVPLLLQNLDAVSRGVTGSAGAIDIDEMNRQEITAAFQAISYIQAFGDKDSRLPDNPTDKQLNEYLKSIRIASHNIIATRAFLGIFSPISPTLRESKGLPDYIKSTGITSMRSEFYDILEGISKTESNEVFDPYELAVAMFTGKNPRKIIYTVARNERSTKVLIQKTNDVKDWSVSNKNFIETYGDAAYIFAPQVGDFTADAYTWMESSGLVKLPKLSDYLDNVQVSVVKQQYFDIERQENELLANETSIPTRRGIINRATANRAALKNAYPLLRTSLETGGFEVATEENLLSSIEEVLLNTSAPVDAQTRQKMSIATKMVREFITFSRDPQSRSIWNFVDVKRIKRESIEEQLDTLIKSDASIREANRAVFGPILRFYSRDTNSIGGN
jgi:hypothetical protein